MYVVKLKEDKYVIWSTIVDAPITFILNKEEIIKYLEAMYPNPKENHQERVDRADQYGTSAQLKMSTEELLQGNRAGPKETELSLEEILEQYK